MAVQPTDPITIIAQDDVNLPSTGQPNKELPNSAVLTTGYDDNQVVTAENLNHTFNNHGLWLSFLDESRVEIETSIQGIELDIQGIETDIQAIESDIQDLEVDTQGLRDDVTVLQNTNLTAGNGLTGGGDLTQDRTFNLGTPSTVGSGSSNSTTSSSHTHALTLTTSNISILTGTIGNGGTIPLPSGYAQSQCKWIVAAGKIVGQDSEDMDRFEVSVNSSRVVTITRDDALLDGFANYMIIGVK